MASLLCARHYSRHMKSWVNKTFLSSWNLVDKTRKKKTPNKWLLIIGNQEACFDWLSGSTFLGYLILDLNFKDSAMQISWEGQGAGQRSIPRRRSSECKVYWGTVWILVINKKRKRRDWLE